MMKAVKFESRYATVAMPVSAIDMVSSRPPGSAATSITSEKPIVVIVMKAM